MPEELTTKEWTQLVGLIDDYLGLPVIPHEFVLSVRSGANDAESLLPEHQLQLKEMMRDINISLLKKGWIEAFLFDERHNLLRELTSDEAIAEISNLRNYDNVETTLPRIKIAASQAGIDRLNWSKDHPIGGQD